MATLELECPGCEQMLELDAGFAGGVCRCSTCGTLMTVPSDSSHAAEKLVRPDRPDRPDAPAPARPDAPDDAGAADAQPQGAADATDTEAEQTYTTASGQTVRVDEAMRIPTAARKKRPMVRALTAGVIVLVLAALVGIVGYALVTVMNADDGVDAEQVAIEQFGYDPTVNVYALEKPNVLGLPLSQTTAVVVDGSAQGRGWLGLVHDAVRVGVTGHDDDKRVGLIYAAESGPSALAEQPTALGELTAEGIHAFQDPIVPAGVASLPAAVQRAMKWQPDKVILVTGQAMEQSQAEAIADHIGGGATKLDVILINESSQPAKQLAESHGGRLVELSQGQLTRWYRSADVPRP